MKLFAPVKIWLSSHGPVSVPRSLFLISALKLHDRVLSEAVWGTIEGVWVLPEHRRGQERPGEWVKCIEKHNCNLLISPWGLQLEHPDELCCALLKRAHHVTQRELAQNGRWLAKKGNFSRGCFSTKHTSGIISCSSHVTCEKKFALPFLENKVWGLVWVVFSLPIIYAPIPFSFHAS